MDAISYSYADKAQKRIKRFIENPDSNSGVLTQPKVIEAGETVTIKSGRQAILADTVVDGDLVIEAGAGVFVPAGSSVDFSNGIKINGEKLTMSIPTAYHIYNGSVEATNTEVTNGFSTTLYTGNGTTQDVITGVDMATQWGDDASETFGGLVWIKSRSVAGSSNYLTDTVRGASKQILSDLTSMEQADPVKLTAFNNNSFSLGANAAVHANLATYASWNFQTTHRRTGVTNHGKAYTEHYNPFTGFTIIKYEGSGIAGHEIPHSLGRKISISTIKNLSAVSDWFTILFGINNFVYLNTTTAGGGAHTHTSNELNITLTNTGYDVSTNQYIMYGWANSFIDETNKLIGNYEVGVYQGTGASGNKVKTRGKPAWIMIKRLDITGDWVIFDNIRGSGFQNYLYANSSSIEGSVSNFIDELPNGFNINLADSNLNTSGGQYLYMVVYDNDSGSGKSKYPKATDTTNLTINALIPLAHGIDSNGSKNNIVVANETITGVTLTEGKNYLYKTDTGYGVKPYEPRYLSSELVRRFAGEQPDYYDVDSNKWFNTDAGSELVTNGTFDSNTNGWNAVVTPSAISFYNGTGKVSYDNNNYIFQDIVTVAGKVYNVKFNYDIPNIVNQYLVFGILNNALTNIVPIRSFNLNTSGVYEVQFTATSSITRLTFNIQGNGAGYGYIDNVTSFPVDITPTTEITESRNYLNHIVHADQNGQVSYVEELPKIEYKDIIKANEYQGKNACTAWVVFNGTTTPPTIRDSYNVSSVVRAAAGIYDVYFEEEMDTKDYSANISYLNNLTFVNSGVSVHSMTKTKLSTNCVANGVSENFPYVTVQVFGGKTR